MDYLKHLTTREILPEVYELVNNYKTSKNAMILHNNFNQKYVGKPYIYIYILLIKN